MDFEQFTRDLRELDQKAAEKKASLAKAEQDRKDAIENAREPLNVLKEEVERKIADVRTALDEHVQHKPPIGPRIHIAAEVKSKFDFERTTYPAALLITVAKSQQIVVLHRGEGATHYFQASLRSDDTTEEATNLKPGEEAAEKIASWIRLLVMEKVAKELGVS